MTSTTTTTSSVTVEVAAHTFKTVYPTEYYARFLDQGIRPDGRKEMETRPSSVVMGTISKANGSALVTLGGTSVVCGIKAEFANPRLDDDKRGWIVPNVMLSPLCSSRFKVGRPSPEAQRLSTFINDVFCSGAVVSEEDMCIIPGKLSWVLYVDVQCLNYDGNVVDACVLAVMAALRDVSLPKVLLPEDTEELEGVPEVDTSVRTPLNIKRTVCACTHALIEEKLMTDPTIDEETLAAASVTIVLDEDGRICAVCQPAPHIPSPTVDTASPLTQTQIEQCIEKSEDVCGLLFHTINTQAAYE
eukprot:m.113825 g.113825  ORF g.113825 m.113825 type:complete len:302 (-) comp12804_c1_seq1:990-1895(-)